MRRARLFFTNNGVLNLQPAGIAMPATATVDTLNFSSGKVTNGTLVLSSLNVFSPATAFPVYPGTMLNAGPVGAAGARAGMASTGAAGG